MNFKRVFSILFSVIFCFMLMPLVCSKNIDYPRKINEAFSDLVVARKISQILNKSLTDVVTQDELNSIEEFRYEGWRKEVDKISSISGIQYLNNLKCFSVIGGNISDLSPLSGLINLHRISITYNKIVNVSPLCTLVNVTDLDLSCNLITDINPISKLPKLKYLSIASNRISDLSPLTSSKEILVLDASQNQIINLLPLASLTNLRELNVLANPIADYKPLSNLRKLRFQCSYDGYTPSKYDYNVFGRFFSWIMG